MNSSFRENYFNFWQPIRNIIDHELIGIFFFLVGLEIKQEFIYGEMKTPRKAFGIILGRSIGKLIGIPFFAWLAIKFGICKAPNNFSIKDIARIGALAGMGLTLSLVIADLAYTQKMS